MKNLAIRELAMGANSRLKVQFGSRHWNALGNNGDTYADTGYQATWEVTRSQAGTAGILVNYTGGDKADTFGPEGAVETGQRAASEVAADLNA